MIELPRALLGGMVAHARAAFPNEACGVLAGQGDRAIALYPMANAEESPVAFRFHEREQLEVFGEIDAKGWELLAFFHSHTRTEAEPSPADHAQAHWIDPLTGDEAPAYPGTRYLILSLKDREPALRAFRFGEGEAVEEDVVLLPASGAREGADR